MPPYFSIIFGRGRAKLSPTYNDKSIIVSAVSDMWHRLGLEWPCHSADFDEVEFVLEEFENSDRQRPILRTRQMRIAFDNVEGVPAGLQKQIIFPNDVGDFQIRKTVLARAEKFSRTAQSQILLGDFKSVGGGDHGFDSAQ